MNANPSENLHKLAVRIAVVAGTFSLIVCALLLYDYSRRPGHETGSAPDFVVIKKALEVTPDDKELQKQLRQLDDQLRYELLRQQAFTSVGAALLLGGGIIFMIAATWAASLRRQLPQPMPKDSQGDQEENTMQIARWAVAGVLTLLVGTAVGLAMQTHYETPNPSERLTLHVDGPGTKSAEENDGKTNNIIASENENENTDENTDENTNQSTDKNANGNANDTESVTDENTDENTDESTDENTDKNTDENTDESTDENTNGNPEAETNGNTEVQTADALPLPSEPASAEELAKSWPRFRGPGGLGISAYTDLPTKWHGATGEGIIWKTAVPLPGNSSPVVCRGRVFLTGADEKQRFVYCLDAEKGNILWQTEVPSTPESEGECEPMKETGFAAPTVATDGYRVFAIFANGDVAALDYAGKVVWSRSLGIPKNAYGHASSLALFEDRLLIQMDQGSERDDLSKLMALDVKNGSTVWEQTREAPSTWPTPIVIEYKDRKQVITASSPWVYSNNPTDGKLLWQADCLSQDVGPSPVYRDGVVYVANEYPGASAIGADGEGDVTDTHIKWEGEDGLPDTACPLVTDKYFFVTPSYGSLTCYRIDDGEMLWEHDFDDAIFTSSPSLVGNHVYLFGQDGQVWIVEPGDEDCEVIAESSMGEECVTSPALLEGRIYIRGKEHMFCIGKVVSSE